MDADCGIHPGSYVFVPAKHFDRPVLGYCEAPATCLRICGSTTNITNLVCRPGRVQCDGPRYDWVSKCVRRPVPRYELAFESGRDAHSHPAHRVENDRIHIFAPKVETPWNNALRPRAQVAVMEKTEIIRSTSGVPDKLVQRYKTDRAESQKAMTSTSSKTARHIMERQQKLVEMEKSRETVAAEAHRQAETVKSKMASVPQRPEVPTGKPPRALPVEPQQTGGDVPPPPAGGKTRQIGRAHV